MNSAGIRTKTYKFSEEFRIGREEDEWMHLVKVFDTRHAGAGRYYLRVAPIELGESGELVLNYAESRWVEKEDLEEV